MIHGYARVSREDQDLRRQVEALETAGVQKVWSEKMSGAKKRPVLEELMSELKAGDKLIVQKIDRLGRSMIDMIQKVQLLSSKGVEFVSIMDNIDISTSNGRLVFNLLSSIAEYEREMIRSRVTDGLNSAKRNGVRLGRPRGNELQRYQEIVARGGDPVVEMGLKRWKMYDLRKKANQEAI